MQSSGRHGTLIAIRGNRRLPQAGPGYADPNYDIAVDWLATRDAIEQAQRDHDDPQQKPRILIITPTLSPCATSPKCRLAR